MERTCAVCGTPFTAQRSTARYCSGSCRARKSQGAEVLPITPPEAPAGGGVLEATRRELDEADRLNTALGQAAMVLARRVDASDRDAGSAAAAVTREWRAMLAEAVKGSAAQSSPLDRARDELAKRRAARGA